MTRTLFCRSARSDQVRPAFQQSPPRIRALKMDDAVAERCLIGRSFARTVQPKYYPRSDARRRGRALACTPCTTRRCGGHYMMHWRGVGSSYSPPLTFSFFLFVCAGIAADASRAEDPRGNHLYSLHQPTPIRFDSAGSLTGLLLFCPLRRDSDSFSIAFAPSLQLRPFNFVPCRASASSANSRPKRAMR